MPIDMLAAIEYGGYISLWKFILLLLAFLGWIPLVNWIFTDTQAVRTNTYTWTLAVMLVGIAMLFLWLLIPVFFIGMLLFLIVVGGLSMAYVTHRNSRVAEFERVLSADHLRGLFSNPEKKIKEASHGISFVTGNGNEVPLPAPKSTELEGFKVACSLLDDATWNRADVIRMIPQKEEYAIVYEIDGTPTKQDPKSREDTDYFIYYAKQLAGLEVEERRKPQKGRFTTILPDQSQTLWEVATSGSTAGEQVRIERVSALSSRKVDEIGLNDNQFESIKSLRDIKEGLIIISGPKKSGLTSTLYTLLGNHDPYLNNINTLEKNPAAELQNITQFTYTLSDTGNETYARRLQSVFRKGPEIVGVGDCDDAQTANLASSAAANDNRIVYVVMEANSVNDTMEKWLRWLKDTKLIADSLTAILNQRLIRKLCEDCRQPYQPNPAIFKKFNIPPSDSNTFYRPGEIEYNKHGKPIVCEKCQGTGFYGRIGLFETVRITDEMRNVIRTAKSAQEITSAFRRSGMLYMQEQSIKKIAAGVTSINEVIRNFASK